MAKKSFKSQFSIRKHKKEKHPQIIIWANRITFKSASLTHSRKDGRSNNIVLIINPDKKDKRQAFVKRRFIFDYKFNYSKPFKDYFLSDEDIEELLVYFTNKKK